MIAPITWFGGKGNNKKFILDNLATCPRHTCFVDAFGGAGNILLNKHPAPVEVYNDLNGWLVNLYRVLRHKDFCAELESRLALTLYSRAEFALALQIMKENPTPFKKPIECAWAMFVAYNQGFGGNANSIGNWGRDLNRTSCGMAGNVKSWKTRQGMLWQWHERISRCQIDNRPALDVCKNFDTPETLFYLDPPYPPDTRKCEGYDHEMSNEDHQVLAEWAKQAKGFVAISTYEHPIYEALGWRKAQKNVKTTFGNSGRLRDGENSLAKNPDLYKRTECLYMNWQYQHEIF